MKLKKLIFLLIILSLFILRIPGCYSFLPKSEIDNGIPEDTRTWKLYRIKWKAGTNPELEKALSRYYSKCNPGCIYEYILDVNLLNQDEDISCNNEQPQDIKNLLKRTKTIFLHENDTCGTNSCAGTAIDWNKIDGDLKNLIQTADAVKIRIPVNSDETSDPRTWKYFKMICRKDDDSIFIKLQDDIGVTPLLDSYTIVVNILEPSKRNQFIVLGDELELTQMRFAWSQLSKPVQNGLIRWTKPNKENLLQIGGLRY
ncbi:MAG: hypothetical protein EHM58_04225 [Ignavibacteriae bacterium]|nr:MAG: hypothetical protein EHM58_04225 [Ignavibacteriota bacterium]